jgi:hypothetical protein
MEPYVMTMIISRVKSFLISRGKNSRKTLHAVSAEDIRKERIKVEQTELRVTREIEELEKQKEAFFSRGVNAGSDRQKIQFARKIKELDNQVQARDQQLALISRNLRVLNGISQLKENERVVRDLGMESLVNTMDLSELQSYVEKATVEGQFQMDKFNEILGALDSAEGVYRFETDDSDTLAILEAMNRASDQKLREGTQIAESATRNATVSTKERPAT